MKFVNYLMLIIMTMPISVGAYAQIDPEQGASLLKPVLEMAMAYLPENVIGIIVLVGGFRVVFKPLMSLLEAFALYTPSKKDDELYKELSEGNTYKTIKFLFDFIASIKLPSKK